MELHQIQVTYAAEEDRLLCRASFKADDCALQEVRAWLTRRMVKLLWPGLIDALERQIILDKPQAAHASADIVGMQHHACIEEIKDSGRFNNPFQSDIQVYPLGEAPILVTTAHFALNTNQPIRVNLTPSQGNGFEIAFTQPVLHGFCSLLKDAVSRAEWDIPLDMPGTSISDAAGRTLN